MHRATGGRVTRAETIHLTLAFLGEIEESRADAAMEAARAARCMPFALGIDQCAYWRHNRIVWAGTRTMPRQLSELAESLRTRLLDAQFVLERRPFHAHVTLIRNAREPVTLPSPAPIEWAVDAFVLVRSRLDASGARYEVIERFGLG